MSADRYQSKLRYAAQQAAPEVGGGSWLTMPLASQERHPPSITAPSSRKLKRRARRRQVGATSTTACVAEGALGVMFTGVLAKLDLDQTVISSLEGAAAFAKHAN